MAISKTLSEILDDPRARAIIDRSRRVDRTMPIVLSEWGADLDKRRPAPAYREGPDGSTVYQGTDLDLFSVVMALSQRRAVINIPHYESQRATSLRSDQYVIDRGNRHGQVVRLVSHKKSHSFGVLIIDYNVVQIQDEREEVGAPRDFMVVNDTGQLYRGWSSLDWKATGKEEEFIRRHGLEAFRDNLQFHYFVPPALAGSFYGSHYLIAKLLETRIADQYAHLGTVEEELRRQGISLPGTKEVVIYSKKGEIESVKVPNLEAKLVVRFIGNYPIYGIESDGEGQKPVFKEYPKMPKNRQAKTEVLRYAVWMRRQLRYRYGPMVRVPTRAVELAFFLNGFKSLSREAGSEIKPGWAVPVWQRGYREGARTRIRWNRLEYNPHIQLIYRVAEHSVQRRVSALTFS